MGQSSGEGNMVNKYLPKQGDIIYINLNPTRGHEQSGFRPAIVISNNVFNKYTNMAIVCPITSNVKEFPTHYILEDSKKVKGAVLCEHIRSIDYDSRSIQFVESASENDFLSIITLMNACVEE